MGPGRLSKLVSYFFAVVVVVDGDKNRSTRNCSKK